MAMYEQVERGEATCKVAVVHVCACDLHHKNVQGLSAFHLYVWFHRPLGDSDSGTSGFSKGDITAETETVTSANYSSDSAAVTKYRYM